MIVRQLFGSCLSKILALKCGAVPALVEPHTWSASLSAWGRNQDLSREESRLLADEREREAINKYSVS